MGSYSLNMEQGRKVITLMLLLFVFVQLLHSTMLLHSTTRYRRSPLANSYTATELEDLLLTLGNNKLYDEYNGNVYGNNGYGDNMNYGYGNNMNCGSLFNNLRSGQYSGNNLFNSNGWNG